MGSTAVVSGKDGMEFGAVRSAAVAHKIKPQMKKPADRSIAAWFGCMRNRTTVTAQKKPPMRPIQSPILRGTGHPAPKPKSTSIPNAASSIAIMRMGMIGSFSKTHAKSVLQIGMR